MCGQWGDHGVTKSTCKEDIVKELSLDEMKSFIDDVKQFNPNITLFGGEPFMYKHIIELVRYLKFNKLHCLVITNGSMLKLIAEELVKVGIDEINLSLDGNESTHDEIRGMHGLFNRIMLGVDEVNAFKAQYKTKKPLINLQCTINKDNYLRLEEMVDVAKEMKANSLTFHNLIFLDENTYSKQEEVMKTVLPDTSFVDWKGFIFKPEIDINLLASKINEIKQIKIGFLVNFYPNFSGQELVEYYNNPQYLPKNYKPRCLSPWIVSYVFPDGTVRPCLNIGYSFGNVKQQKFKDIWNSNEAVKYRQVLKQNQIFPACIRCTELFRY
jgi:radical SAM protein with 4Fe4S-binding SPASM domain